jgi:hypothetical protein
MTACTLHIKLFPWHQKPKWPQQPQWPQWPQQPHFTKNLYFKVKMYIFDGLLNFINWKRPLKVKILRKKWICDVSQIEPWMACNIDSIKTGEVGKNVGFSGTHTTSYIMRNLNVYPHQSRITFHTLLWDTLYMSGLTKMAKFTEKNALLF